MTRQKKPRKNQKLEFTEPKIVLKQKRKLATSTELRKLSQWFLFLCGCTWICKTKISKTLWSTLKFCLTKTFPNWRNKRKRLLFEFRTFRNRYLASSHLSADKYSKNHLNTVAKLFNIIKFTWSLMNMVGIHKNMSLLIKLSINTSDIRLKSDKPQKNSES